VTEMRTTEQAVDLLKGVRTVGPKGRAGFRSESGQALVELALVTPLLILLVIGVIDIGRYAYQGILVGNAARAGAGYGAQNPYTAGDPTGICDAASDDFQGSAVACSGNTSTGTNGTLSVTSTFVCECDNAGTISAGSCTSACAVGTTVSSVKVTASGSFSPIFTYPGIPSPLALSRTATMRIGN
jgi:Flp pilus assembly protein TadG